MMDSYATTKNRIFKYFNDVGYTFDSKKWHIKIILGRKGE